MAVAVTIPRLGWNMDEGVFIAWLKQDGDPVRAGDVLFSLEGEKATQDIESFDNGILRIAPSGPQEGDTLPVGAVIAYLVQPGEQAPFEGGPQTENAAVVAEKVSAAPAASPTVRQTPREASAPAAAASSPRARRVAAELGIDWTQLHGSSRTGRIRERDVREAAALRTPGPDSLPLSPIRKTIAERMLTSARATAAVTLTTTAAAANLVNLRNQFKAVPPSGSDPVPSYSDFLVKLTAEALRVYPLLNASWAGEQIVLSAGVHIGIAVDTEAGLLVPVIRDVPGLGLKQIATLSRDLTERARQGKLRAEEMQGGTFTLTNLGAFGIDAFTPIINYPQCAVLGVGRIQRRPAVEGERVVVREEVTLSLTFDHRIVDGAPAARFLQTLSRLIENPGPALVG